MDSKTPLSRWTTRANRCLQGLLEAGFKLRSLRPSIPNSLLSAQQAQIEVRVIGTAAMKKLNAESLGHDYATDVLSFPTASFFRELGHLGALVVCREVCVRQAREHGHRPEAELELLLVHGLLHLLGFDHERSPEEAVQMAALEGHWLEAYRLGRRSDRTAGLIARAERSVSRKKARSSSKAAPRKARQVKR